MVAHKWRWALYALRRYRHDQRGGVLVFVAISIVPLLGMAGLALDLGRAYVVKAQLSRAVDAGSLAAGRALRQGRGLAQQEAFAVAGANGVRHGHGGVALAIEFGVNVDGEQTVALVARKPMPTLFMRLLGRDVVDISSAAEAAIPPVDMVLVLDRSGSLATQNAWVPLQNAASQFVQMFDDQIDQLGLVSFQVRAQDEFLINGNFKLSVSSAINAMNSVGDTNTGEGLRYAYEQLQRPNVRSRSAKVVVFFTDGRPTAFRGSIGASDRVLAVPTIQTGWVRGYFNNPHQLPMNQGATPHGCAQAPTCFGYNESTARAEARQSGITAAERLRADDIYVYTIGLGNPGASNPLLVPDTTYLQLLANQNGIANGNQPHGRSYFAPSAAELHAVFQAVAQDLLVRLSR